MENEQNLKVGEKVIFDIEGEERSPYGSGVVTFVSKLKTLISPDANLCMGMKMINIRKVE